MATPNQHYLVIPTSRFWAHALALTLAGEYFVVTRDFTLIADGFASRIDAEGFIIRELSERDDRVLALA